MPGHLSGLWAFEVHQQSGEQSLLEIPRGESMGRNGPGMGNPGEGGHVVPTDRLHLLLRLHIHTQRIGRVTAANGNNIKEDKTASPSLVPKHAASTLFSFISSTDSLLPVGSWLEFPSGVCFVPASYFLTAPLKLHWWWPLTSWSRKAASFPHHPLSSDYW